jgi:DNA-binding IclR family transcriptional regulator
MKPNLSKNNSVLKAFHILFTFTKSNPEKSLAEIAKETNLNKTTVYRYLSSLVEIGIIDKNEQTSSYRLSLKLFDLGNRVQIKSNVVDLAHPILKDLVRKLKITVHLATIDRNEIVYLDKIKSQKSLQMHTSIGARVPVHCTALGKSMLAYLPESEIKDILNENTLIALTSNTVTNIDELLEHLKKYRLQGFAVDNEEFEEGLRCVAVPILGVNNSPIAVISVSGTPLQISEKTIPNIVASLKKAAKKISQQLVNLGITLQVF